MNKYFSNFPTINYNGVDCLNILERVALRQSVAMSPLIFYPFDIESNERADSFSARYYKDPYLSWTIYLSNNIMDPLKEWILSDEELNNLITLKYGSLQLASSKIKFYRNDWANSSKMLANGYNALPVILQNYWEPVDYVGNRITSYRRKQIDYTLNTNKIATYSLANTSFTVDEIVDIHFDINNSGQGQVLSVSNTSINVQHLSGTYKDTPEIPINNNSYVVGQESLCNSAFSTNSNDYFIPVSIIATNITPEEEIYWTPVTYYEYETEKNEFNRTIRVLDSRFAPLIASNLNSLLSNT